MTGVACVSVLDVKGRGWLTPRSMHALWTTSSR